MAPTTERTTVYLDAALRRALRLKAAEDGLTISELVNRAVRSALAEDLEDVRDLDARAGEPSRPFEAFLAELDRDGLL